MNPSKLITELQLSARLGKTFPVGWPGGLVGGLVGQHSWGWNFAVLGKNVLERLHNLKNEDNIQNEDNLKNEGDLKN